MTDLEKLKKENEHLKYLLKEVYDTSFINEMIDDGCKDRNNDEMLGYNIYLKCEIKEVLNLSTEVKDVANKVRQDLKSATLKSSHNVLNLKNYSIGKPPKKTN